MTQHEIYIFCKDSGCKKFKEEEDKVVWESESAFDAAYDMKCFVDDCCKTCPIIAEKQKEGQNERA